MPSCVVLPCVVGGGSRADNVLLEIETALQLHRQKRIGILPLLVGTLSADNTYTPFDVWGSACCLHLLCCCPPDLQGVCCIDGVRSRWRIGVVRVVWDRGDTRALSHGCRVDARLSPTCSRLLVRSDAHVLHACTVSTIPRTHGQHTRDQSRDVCSMHVRCIGVWVSARRRSTWHGFPTGPAQPTKNNRCGRQCGSFSNSRAFSSRPPTSPTTMCILFCM